MNPTAKMLKNPAKAIWLLGLVSVVVNVENTTGGMANIKKVMKNVEKIFMPPTFGILPMCDDLLFGFTTSCFFIETFMTIGISEKPKAKEKNVTHQGWAFIIWLIRILVTSIIILVLISQR